MKYFLQFLFGVLIVYIIGSFVSGVWNPEAWSIGGRTTFVFFGIIFGLTSVMLFNADKLPSP
jgi:hypothetical protein